SYAPVGVNTPGPAGHAPSMRVACMDHAGAIKDTNPSSPACGQMITGPLYNPNYSQFCYGIPFMPGQTQYMDAPVVPTAAFAGGYNPPDCSYPDAAPAIKQVDGDGVGPWVSAMNHNITITALGD